MPWPGVTRMSQAVEVGMGLRPAVPTSMPGSPPSSLLPWPTVLRLPVAPVSSSSGGEAGFSLRLKVLLLPCPVWLASLSQARAR